MLTNTLNAVKCCLERAIAAVKANILVIETAATDLSEDVAALAAATAFGNATLVGGTVAVANTNITSGSIVVLGRKTIGGTVGNVSYTVSAGVGFTINSSSGTDTSVMSYIVKY